MRKKLILFVLLTLILYPLLSCNKDNYGYGLKLNSKNTVELTAVNTSILDEDGNLVTGSLSTGVNYELKTIITGINNTDQDVANYSMSINVNGPIVSFNFVEGDTSSENTTGTTHTFNFSVGRGTSNLVTKQIICSFTVTREVTQNDLYSYFSYSFYECSINNLETTFSVVSTSIERFANESHEYLRFLAYPQDQITDKELCNHLNNYFADFDRSYLTKYVSEYDGKYYLAEVTSSGGFEFFEIKPILWRVLSHNNDTYVLMSEYVLDFSSFSDMVVEDEDSNEMLNDLIEYSEKYGNGFGTLDNISLVKGLNIAKLTSEEYSFSNSAEADIERVAYASDYVIYHDIYTNGDGCARYWTLSKSLYFDSLGYYVTENGALESLWKAYSSYEYGVRPIITVKIGEDD